jgi:hypothetical protein
MTVVVVLAAYAAIWVNLFASTAIRFTIPAANYLFFLAAQALPFRALFLPDAWPCWRRAGALVVAVPLVFVALMSACTTSACLVLGRGMVLRDPSFEQIHAVETRRGRLAVYRTDGGAMTACPLHCASFREVSVDFSRCHHRRHRPDSLRSPANSLNVSHRRPDLEPLIRVQPWAAEKAVRPGRARHELVYRSNAFFHRLRGLSNTTALGLNSSGS